MFVPGSLQLRLFAAYCDSCWVLVAGNAGTDLMETIALLWGT